MHGVRLSGEQFLKALFNVKPRPEWIRAIKKLRQHGVMTATITNNFKTSDDPQKNLEDQESISLFSLKRRFLLLQKEPKNFLLSLSFLPHFVFSN